MFFKKINMRLVSVLCLIVLILTSVDQAHAGVFMPTVLPFAPEAESVTSTVAASPSGANPTPRDIMLVIDTSLSMAFATDGDPTSITDNPAACNASHTCQPMETVKSDAMDFVDLLTFPADRVGIVTMTSQSLGGSREPMLVLPLTNDKTAIQNALSNLKVFQPPVCVRDSMPGKWISPSKGICLEYDSSGHYIGTNRPIWLGGADLDENTTADNFRDPTTLMSSNIGGSLYYANDALIQSARNDSSWVTILLAGGPANATSTDDVVNYPDGFCPQSTWNKAGTTDTPNCRDNDLLTPFQDTPLITRHTYGDPNYDADDYARDAADVLASITASNGITIHTIGLGIATGLPNQLRNAPIGLPTSGENLLTYIAHQTNDGQYYYAEDPINLPAIFADIAGVVTDPNGRYVSPTGSDTSPTTCNSPLVPCLTINKAIQSAVAGNTIYVTQGTYTSASGSYVVSLNKNLTLSGGWDNAYANQIGFSTIDGQNTRQGISVAAVSTIDHFVVQNGFTAGLGGGISVNSAVTINNSLVTHNSAAIEGGGIFASNNVTLNNTTIENNSAPRGAGIDLYSLNSLTLNNSTISGNQATNQGGGIYMNGISGSGTANIVIQNSTITHNSALTGGGIYSGGSSPRRNLTITNSILSGNIATTGNDCAASGLTPVSSSNHNILGSLSNCGITTGAGDLVGVDPQLANSPSGDLHYYALISTSPAIDAGSNCLAADQRGMARPQGSACDIGAFEYSGVGAAASFGLASGSNQQTGLLAPFAEPLAVYVVDAVGNPVAGTLVTFTAPASGPSGTFASNSGNAETVTSNNSGLAVSSTFSANAMAGSYTVIATADGLPGSVNFLLTNTELYVSTSGNDSNSCMTPASPCLTINGASAKASAGATIKVASGTYKGTGSQVVSLTKGLTISGGWNSGFTLQNGFSIIDGESARNGVKVNAPTSGSLSRFIIKNGNMGIDHSFGDFTYTMVALLNNKNGMYITSGNASLVNSTINGGHSSGLAGSAISNVGGSVTVQYSTIANNSGSSAIYSVNGGAVVNLGNTILSNNPAGNCTAGAANLISSGNNIIDTSPACTGNGFAPLASDKVGVDPKLGPLFPLGFHVLYTDSPAINQAGAGTCPFTDQVGNTRPQDSACDIGAYEYSSGGTTPTNILHTLANPQITLTPELSTTTFSARILDANGAGVPGVTVTFTAPSTSPKGIFAGTGAVSTATTNSKGEAVSALFTANEIGNYDLIASAGGMQVVYNVSYIDLPPTVLSSLRASADPTAAASVDYTLTFSESVTGVDKDDFTLTTSGVTGTSITTVTGSGSNYTVKVNTGSGNGTIRLDVKHEAGIVDGGLNPMVASFTSGEVYTVAKTSSLLVSPTNDGYLASVTPAFTWKAITGALEYQLQVDETEWFTTPEVNQSQPSGTTFTSPALDYGIHYWRMRVRTSGGWGVWTAGWKFTLTPTLPAAPTLASPASAAVLADNTPLLTWNMVLADDRYEVQIDNLNTFASPEQTFTSGLGVLSYTAATLPDGVWNWRVRAINYLNLPGVWSTSRSFTVDTVGPLAPVLNAPANDTTVIGTPAFSWTAATTASKYQFEYDSDADFSSPAYTSAELTATSHTPPDMPLGSYSWHVRAKDAAGNWGLWSASRVVTILSQIPIAPTLTAPANAFATNDSTPSFSWVAVTSGETYQLEISNATTFAIKQQTFSGTPGVLTYTATNIPDGLWYWHVRAVNVNGVAGAWSAYRSFTIDTTAPVTAPTLSAPANAASVIGTPAFSWGSVATATKYEFQYDNDTDFSSPIYTSAELTTLNHTPPAMVLGTYSWRVRARDAVGNWSAWSTARTVTILPPVPVAPVLTSPANALVTTDATPDFVWASVVSGDTYQLEISNATTFATKQQTFSGASGVLTYTATTIPDGLWYWHVRALNVNGVAGPWSAYRSFTVDTTGPVAPAMSAPANAAAVIGTPAFSWAAAATALKYQLAYDNDADFSSPIYTSAELTTTSHTPPAMALGLYSWHVRAKDAAGNWGLWSTARTVTILPLVPVAPALTAPANAFVTNDSTPDFVWASVPSGETYQLEISNATTFAAKQQTFTGATGILTYIATTIPDGLWYWHVRAVNVNGVVGTWSAYRSFTVDTNGPSAPTLSAPANAAIATGTPAFSWAATTTAVKYQFEYDNDADFSSPIYNSGDLTTTSHTPPVMALGAYSWHVRAKDAAGNWGPWSLTRTITIQPLVPVAPALTTPAASAVTNDSTPDFVWASVVSGDTYQLEISNATTFATKQQTFSGAPGVLTYTATNIPDGFWYWHVRSVNVNGVAGAWSAYRSFTVDTIAPVAPTLSSPANAASVIGTAAFSWTSVATASKYQFEYDNDIDFSSPVYTSGELTVTSHTPPAMALGTYSWHVRVKDAAGNWSLWSTVRTVTVLSTIPVAPALTVPANAAVTNDPTPDFTWASVTAGDTYQLEISNATTFATKQQTFSGAPGVLTYTATTIPDGVWYWHIRSVNVNGTAGPWSAYRSFTVDTVAPVAPTLSSPANAASVSGTPAFSWASVATAAKYQFEYDNDADFSSPVYTSADLTTTSHTPPSIAQGVYSWHVRAKDAAGNWGAWSMARTVTIFPLVPATPTLTSPVYGALSRDPAMPLAWTAMPNAATYQVQVDNNSTFSSPEFDTTTPDTSILITEFPDGVYYWRVRQIDILGGVSLWSTVWRVTIIRPTPNAPATDTPAIVDTTGIPTFTWNSVQYGVNYIIQVDNDSNFSSPLVDDVADTLSRSFVMPFASGQYHWRVRAISEYGIIGPWSATWTLTVDLVPAAPTLLLPADAATSLDGEPSFSWQSAANADEYQIQVDNDSDFSSPEFDNTAPQTTRGLPAPLTDGTYFWRVRGVNGVGSVSEWSAVRELTVDIPPASPTLLTPEVDSTNADGLPTLSWDAVPGSFSYEIQVDDNANFSSLMHGSTVDSSMREVVLALGNGTYHWRIRAVNILGTPGDWSAVWTFTVDVPPVAPILLEPEANSISTDGLPILHWGTVTGGVAYEVQLNDSEDFSSPLYSMSVYALALNLDTPLDNGTYHWRVRAMNMYETLGPWSAAQSFAVDAEIVTPPPLPWPPTSTALPTITATITQSPTPTKTSTITSSPTRTPSVTPSKTYTPTRTPTSSRTPTKTLTPTMTRTPTQTFTPTLTPAPVCTNIYIDRARFNGDSFEARVRNDNPSTAYLVETILTWDPSPLTNGRFFDRALWNAVAYSDPANVANSESPVVTSSIPPELSLPGNGSRITWDADFSDSNFTGLYAITLTFNYPGWGDCVLSAGANMYTPTSTQTPFDTPSPTLTHTPTTTATATNTAINTPTSTPTASPTRTPTSTSTVDPTETYTPTPTATPTKTPTVTPTSTYCQDC